VVAEKLMHSGNNIPVIINSVTKSDFKTAVAGIKIAEKAGKRFLFRTGASFVSEYTGVTEKPLFVPERPVRSCLIIAGSFVNRTTQQLLNLEKNIPVSNIRIESKLIVSRREKYLSQIIQRIEDDLLVNKKVLVSTEREYMGEGSISARIDFGKKLSVFICEMVAGIHIQPELIIAKGGITSHDVLKSGLGVQKSKVLGQVYPGVPILKLDESGKFPGSFYVIFPGNVGNESTLTEIVQKFSK
ncbi:MAG TPA: nucleotide-binding domain containing protein, partial [Draconibacterium sp.]|nr:nucleotide-binding domain containing protein [Draconibacterium sp.]